MGTSGTLSIRVAGKAVRWYNHNDSYPDHWAPYIIAELRMLLLLHPLPALLALVNQLQPIDDSQPPTPTHLTAFRPFVVPRRPDPYSSRSPWLDLLKPVRQSLIAVLTIGWYEQHDLEEQYNYDIDLTGEGSFTFSSGEQTLTWAGLRELPGDVVQQMVRADHRWTRELNEEEGEEEQHDKDGAKALALKDKANQLYREKRYEDALSVYHEATTACPATDFSLLSTLYSNQAAACLFHSHPSAPHPRDAFEAIRRCYHSVAIQPSVKALYRLASAREMLGMMRSAVIALQVAVALENIRMPGGDASKEVADKLQRLEKGSGRALHLSDQQVEVFAT